MPRLQKFFKTYSIIFIAFGIISFAYSSFSDLLGLINENMQYDTVSDAQMLPFMNGGVFIIIGGLLEVLAGLYGYKASENLSIVFKPILFSVLAISWQITGFIMLLSNHILNIRLFLQIPMTFIFLAISFFIKFKNTQGLKKKHININPLPSIGNRHTKIKKRNIANLFQTNRTRKHIRIPFINTGKRRKRVNIKPMRKFGK